MEVQRCSREKDIGGDLGLCLNAPTDGDVTTPRGSPKCNSGHLRELESPFLFEEDYFSLSAPLTLVSNTELWNHAHHRHRFDMHLSRAYCVLGNVVGAEAIPWKEALKEKAPQGQSRGGRERGLTQYPGVPDLRHPRDDVGRVLSSPPPLCRGEK